MKEFAKRLKDLRAARGLSQVQLAEQANLRKSSINAWENEIQIANIEALVVLAKFFGVTTDYLLGLTDY